MDDAMSPKMAGMDMPVAPAPSPPWNSSVPADADCKVTMLWNWHTIDACFLSQSWQIRSGDGFAAFCIGVVLLVVLLEALRRMAKFYDQNIVRTHRQRVISVAARAATRRSIAGPRATSSSASASSSSARRLLAEKTHIVSPTVDFRPTFIQQGIRALLHTVQFAVAYWIMLLAMYCNGYILICILLGAFLGAFVFRWERLGGHQIDSSGNEVTEAMGCCG